MDKGRVKAVLAPYSPPLSPTQIDEISSKIARVSAEEISDLLKTPEAPKPARKKSRRS